MRETNLVEQMNVSLPSDFAIPADDDIEKAMVSEIAAFHRLHPTLLKKYPGEFVAIYNQQLVDHDVEKLALYRRIQERYPDQFVLMRRVENEPEIESTIP